MNPATELISSLSNDGLQTADPSKSMLTLEETLAQAYGGLLEYICNPFDIKSEKRYASGPQI